MDKRARESSVPALRPGQRSLCVVMVCMDMSEADQVGRTLSELNTGCLVTYRRVEDLMSNAPTGQVALVILASDESPTRLERTLQWLRRRWPGCPLTVIGDAGSGTDERVARAGSALYLTRPVAGEDWSALLSHVLPTPAPAPEQQTVSRRPTEGGATLFDK